MHNFYPNRYFRKKEDIPFAEYYNKGYRGVIFDIDNTLVPHNANADQKAIRLIQELKKIGYQICLLSNNQEQRVASFNEPLQVKYIYKGGKPSRRGYKEALSLLGTNPENTLFVGDQIFTDIWGARRTGLYSILLDPIHPKEEIQIVLKRIPERWIKRSYRKKNQLGKTEFDSKI